MRAALPDRVVVARTPACLFSGVQGGARATMRIDDKAGPAGAPIRVLVADDHPVVRNGLAGVIAQQPELALVAEAPNGRLALERFREHRPDVVLMDLRMPDMDGVSAIKAIRAEFPDARILALTTYDGDVDIYRALEAGARGYLIKDMLLTDVLSAIRAVHRGERVIPTAVAAKLAEFTPRTDLTPREVEVLQLVARGLSNRDVGGIIGRTDETVKVHLKNIFAKLGVADRTEAVTLALSRGILHLH
ncbi:MAG: response regulator receiver [Gemmatimonadetes bacterium]|nr:response regulator receiver [Gemmatimonadota bacterium]